MNNFKKILFILTLILCLNILIVNTVEAMSVNVMYWNDGGSYDNFYREIDQDESINLWYEVSISAINPSEELPVSVTLYREHNGDITYYNYDDGAQSYVLNNQQFSYIPITDEITIEGSSLELGVHHIILTSQNVFGDPTDSVILTLDVDEPTGPQTSLDLEDINNQIFNEDEDPWIVNIPYLYNGQDNIIFLIDSSNCGTDLSFNFIQTSDNLQIMINALENFNLPVGCNIIIDASEENGDLSDSTNFNLIINAVDDAPVALDDVFDVMENSENNQLDVLNNDFDLDINDDIIIYFITASNNGIVTFENNYIYYTPNTDFNGIDSFSYTISDGNGGFDSATVTINVLEEHHGLVINYIDCQQDPIIVEGLQTCQIEVMDSFGNLIDGANVEVFYLHNNELIDLCITEDGYCGVEFQVSNLVGDYTVYANANLEGYVSYQGTDAQDTFEVIEQMYEISNFYIYNSQSQYTDEFYRGESIFVEFQVFDITNNGNLVLEELISGVRIYDETSGSTIDLTGTFENGQYLYSLNSIPLNDNFLGENYVISFVYDESLNMGGQEYGLIDILNNLPEWNNIPNQLLEEGSSIIIDLSDYSSDLEDDYFGIDLQYDITEISMDIIDAAIFNNYYVMIEGLNAGLGSVEIKVEDHNGGIRIISIDVSVIGEGHIINANFNSMERAHLNEIITFDASDSQGHGLTYSWDFGDGIILDDASNIITHSYSRIGYYIVTLTVEDNYNQIDTETKTILVDTWVACSDGLDNDGDGLIDMDDPGCENPGDASEDNLPLDIEDGIMFQQINIYSINGNDIFPGDDVFVSVKVKNFGDEDIEDLKLTLLSTDLGLKIRSSKFNLDNGESEVLEKSFYIPYDVPAGEYPLRVSVANDDLKHSKWVFYYVVN